MSTVATDPLSITGRIETIVPLVLVAIVFLMVVPLAPTMLDVLLAVSMALSIALMLASVYAERALDLSVFPTILLFATLLRLALNVASTRLILLHGGEGATAAGRVIHAFGEFLIGGNYVVGGAMFVLLVLINFVVITKGAGRVAEVSARFNLDALPGKQMSIDADLGAGLITTEQAQERRRALAQESEFFGAMDGASKFVRGDAIAGLLMTGINIVVGFVVGVAQQDMSAADAAATYTILTVGDGLASQIPALLVSTAAGVIVTRAAAGDAIGPALVRQLGQHQRVLEATAALLFGLGFLPGMPMIPFAALSLCFVMAARAAKLEASAAGSASSTDGTETARPKSDRERIAESLSVDLLELEIGFELLPLVDPKRGGELVERISAIRRRLASEFGMLVPPVNVRDNLRLRGGAYQLVVSGNVVGKGELRVGSFLAMDPTGTLPPIAGDAVREPAFGLPAIWIDAGARERVEGLGYTVVDPASVAATHLTELIRTVSPELLGRREAQELVDILAAREPRLVDEVVPNLLSFAEVIQILRTLLREQVSIRDLRTIFEALSDHARLSKNVDLLAERVRQRLARSITARFKDEEDRVAALVLDPRAEESFRNGGPDASSAQRLLAALDRMASSFAGLTTPPLILCAQDVRRGVSEFLRRRIPGLSVVSYSELDPTATVKTLGVVTP